MRIDLKFFWKNLSRILVYVALAATFLYISRWSTILSISLIIGMTWGFLNEMITHQREIKEELKKQNTKRDY